ncbi:MAG: TolC family protein [Deltaproteobacteria bacterium]|nr:TolC family protein [Deltaproteobacteria bacterium]
MRLWWWLCAVLCLLSSPPAFSTKIVVNLEQAIQTALKKNPEIREADILVGVSEGQLEEAKAAQYPKIETLSFMAPIFRITGNALDSSRFTDIWGYYFKSEGKGYIPLYTWNKISSFKEAARNKIIVDKNKTKETINEVIFKVKEYFYTYQLAWTLSKEGKDLLDKVEKVIKKAQEHVEKETGEVTRVDLYKLRVFHAAGLAKLNKAVIGQDLTKSALAMQIGYDANSDIDIEKHKISQDLSPMKDLSFYTNLALQHRPEMQQLKHGLAARDALVRAEKANYFPMIALGGAYDIGESNVVEDQYSYFAHDPYNISRFGAAIAFKWDIDFFTTKAKVKQKRAEHDALIAKNEYAVRGIPMQVKKAFLQAKEYEKNIGYAREGKKNADKWFLNAGFGTAFGLGEVKDTLEGGAAAAMMLKDYYQAIFDYNMALSELSKVTGIEVTQLKY